VGVKVETDYPFDETIRITLHLPQESAFPLKLRIPGWAEGATVTVCGEILSALPGTFHTLDRVWKDGETIELHFPMKVRAERRYRDSITLTRGPLVYSLKIGERWERVRGEDPCPDYAVYPTTPWNYGLLVDPDDPRVEVVKKGVGDVIYGPDFAPVELRVKGRRIPEWGMQDNCSGPVPESPVTSSEPLEDLTLIPYGCAKLRITEFPLLEG